MPDLIERGLAGIIAPVLLPLDAYGEPDHATLRQHVRYLLDAGVDGLWVNGSTGEFFALTPTQRTEVVRTCADETAGAVPVLAQVGAPGTAETLSLAKDALSAGASHLSVIAPYYADFTEKELVRHYQRVSTETGQPLVLYHFPKRTKVALSIDSILELHRTGAATAIKDSANDITWYRTLLLALAEKSYDLRCFTGGGSLTDVGLFLGGAGGMPAIVNLAPRTCVAIYDAFRTGEWPRAVQLQQKLDRAAARIQLPRRKTWAASISAYKYLLVELGRLPSDAVCEPGEPLADDERAALRADAVPYLRAIEDGLCEPAG